MLHCIDNPTIDLLGQKIRSITSNNFPSYFFSTYLKFFLNLFFPLPQKSNNIKMIIITTKMEISHCIHLG